MVKILEIPFKCRVDYLDKGKKKEKSSWPGKQKLPSRVQGANCYNACGLNNKRKPNVSFRLMI